ncbi:hypothetical protein [Catellatospora sichuanensis]|uniref:hypothetical protein n=1 Tax=Catellatospora sichuanensis TaxID=1969805 RepID=UPI0011842165|nr:hypothetical protein [Catellatospora sichuanensis]
MRSSRVLGYGLGVWLGMVGISLILLPAEGKHEALYESIKLTAMVALVLGFAIRYLRRRPEAAGPEGVLVGLVWAAVTTAGDLGLYLGGAFNIGLDVYFTDVASSYAVMPVITGLAIGLLAPKPAPTAVAGSPTAAEPAAADAFAAIMAVSAAVDATPDGGRTAASGIDAVSETHTAPEILDGPEIHAVPAQADVPAATHVPNDAPAVITPVAEPSHAEASLVGAAAAPAQSSDDTDRPLYIPRGNC